MRWSRLSLPARPRDENAIPNVPINVRNNTPTPITADVPVRIVLIIPTEPSTPTAGINACIAFPPALPRAPGGGVSITRGCPVSMLLVLRAGRCTSRVDTFSPQLSRSAPRLNWLNASDGMLHTDSSRGGAHYR